MDAQNALERYLWPGNIRELENAIERAANYVWEGEIMLENLPVQVAGAGREAGSGKPLYKKSVENFQKEMLLDALRQANGNRSAAARLLNLSRSAFYERLKKYNI